MKNKKKDGVLITNWQLHHLEYSDAMLKKVKEMYPGTLMDPGPMAFTGTVVEDPTGRWRPGFHMRSSLIVKIDREKGIIETQNTIYKVKDEGNDVFPDLGNGVMGIFY